MWATAACVGGVLFLAAWYALDRTGECGSDFSAFYAGGKLLWQGSIYDQEAVRQLQREMLGCKETGNSFIRLPFFAAAMAPLARLPYDQALWIWKLLLACAAAAFIYLWPQRRWQAAALVFWSLPLVTSFTYGQDTIVILLAFAAALRMSIARRQWGTGALLALGAVKIHLFAWVPILAVLRRLPRLLAGWAVAGAGLAAVSFLAAGFSWPAGFAASALNPAANPHVETMVNFRGLFHGSAHALGLEIAASLVLVAAVARSLLRWPFEHAACLALAVSVPIGHHSYLYDLALLLPLCLIVITGTAPRWLKASALAVASPVLTLLPFPWTSETTCQIAVPVLIACAAVGYSPAEESGQTGTENAMMRDAADPPAG